jgi:hypothetical protein
MAAALLRVYAGLCRRDRLTSKECPFWFYSLFCAFASAVFFFHATLRFPRQASLSSDSSLLEQTLSFRSLLFARRSAFFAFSLDARLVLLNFLYNKLLWKLSKFFANVQNTVVQKLFSWSICQLKSSFVIQQQILNLTNQCSLSMTVRHLFEISEDDHPPKLTWSSGPITE